MSHKQSTVNLELKPETLKPKPELLTPYPQPPSQKKKKSKRRPPVAGTEQAEDLQKALGRFPESPIPLNFWEKALPYKEASCYDLSYIPNFKW